MKVVRAGLRLWLGSEWRCIGVSSIKKIIFHTFLVSHFAQISELKNPNKYKKYKIYKYKKGAVLCLKWKFMGKNMNIYE